MAWTQTKPVLNRDVAKKIQQRLQDLGHLTMLVEQSVPEEWMVPQTHNHD
jgi:arginine decarboxylase-like protein